MEEENREQRNDKILGFLIALLLTQIAPIFELHVPGLRLRLDGIQHDVGGNQVCRAHDLKQVRGWQEREANSAQDVRCVLGGVRGVGGHPGVSGAKDVDLWRAEGVPGYDGANPGLESRKEKMWWNSLQSGLIVWMDYRWQSCEGLVLNYVRGLAIHERAAGVD